MLSLIEVKCPHCGAQGQMMLPPLGSIIVGPCPECQGMVVIFCGKALPLDPDIMNKPDTGEKRDHVMEVLGLFVHERVERLFERLGDKAECLSQEMTGDAPDGADGDLPPKIEVFGNAPSGPISREELNSFLSVDLKLIDNHDYFKAVFE